MSSLVIGGDVSGTVTLQAPSAAGSTVLTLPSTSGTLVTTAGGNAPTATTATNLASGSAGNVPYQTGSGATGFVTNGTAGQVLTSAGASAPTWSTLVVSGSGGATASDNVTLTSSSSGAQSITTTTYGQYVKLPDATTMTKAACVFNITNAGGFPLKIQNSAGTTKGFVPAYQSVTVGLADNSTAAGTWVLAGATQLEIIGQYSYATAITEGVSVMTKIDSDRDLILYGVSATGFYGIIYNRTTQTWGSPTLIRSSCPSGQAAALKTATDQVLVASALTTAMQAVVLTLSGTTITVGTAATATLSSSISKMSNSQQNNAQLSFVTVGSSYVLSYVVSTSSVPQLRAMTISGTTVTIGNATVESGITNQSQLFAVSSSVLLSFSAQTGTNSVYATPYTISGTTITTGTAATVSGVTGNLPRVTALGSRWAMLNLDGSGFFVASIISVSGTTATASTATLNAVAVQETLGWCVVGSKVVAVGQGLSAGDPTKFHVVSFSDNAGTISYGTALAVSTVNNVTTPCLVATSSTTAALNIRVSGSKVYQWTINVSAASPTATIRCFGTGVVNATTINAINPYDSVGLPQTLISNGNVYPNPTAETYYNGQYPLFELWGSGGFVLAPTPVFSMSGYTAVSTDGSYMFGANCYSTTYICMWIVEAAQ